MMEVVCKRTVRFRYQKYLGWHLYTSKTWESVSSVLFAQTLYPPYRSTVEGIAPQKTIMKNLSPPPHPCYLVYHCLCFFHRKVCSCPLAPALQMASFRQRWCDLEGHAWYGGHWEGLLWSRTWHKQHRTTSAHLRDFQISVFSKVHEWRDRPQFSF